MLQLIQEKQMMDSVRKGLKQKNLFHPECEKPFQVPAEMDINQRELRRYGSTGVESGGIMRMVTWMYV